MNSLIPPSSPLFARPAQACDCHVHVFLPREFPYAQERSYTPGEATAEDLAVLMQRLGMARVVLVQPSCYGTDNRALMSVAALLGKNTARAVAVVDLEAAPDLASMDRQGVRGLRFNLSVRHEVDVSAAERQLKQAAHLLEPLGWHVQIHASAQALAALRPTLAELRVPVVLDHFGGGAAGASVVGELLRTGKVWVKLSAPYRASQGEAHQELASLTRAWAAIAPQRLLWASDWPHTGGSGVRISPTEEIEPFRAVDAAGALRELEQWIADDGLLERILVSNPADLYGF
ncbi:MAG: amidohydrolase family protein [Ottowia sp.]|uniref:amidohydrolase family protein n=1 Tax=Ottowia sp. TaxID=1898956 RepID=UPI003C749D4F